MVRPFHLGWFGNFTVPDWKDPFTGNVDAQRWTNGDFLIEMTGTLERAGFDFFMLEDSLMVPDVYGGTAELELKHALYAPKLDPIPLIPLLAKFTKHIGLVATASTTFYPPFMLARVMSTLDHLTEGRVGWNMVTTSETRAAENFGRTLPPHDLRYDMADEFVDLVTQLWASWDADAVVMDPSSGVYADHQKVHTVNFEGQYHRSRGPLNVLSSPQARPVLTQAGGSPRGRAFAARHSDVVLAISDSVAGFKAYRDDIRERARGYGRNPDDVKVMFVIRPMLGATEADAQEEARRFTADEQKNIELRFVDMSALMEIDMSAYSLDEPFPESVSTEGHTTVLQLLARAAKGKTLREAMKDPTVGAMSLVGTPESVASMMEDINDEVGGDGFLIARQPLTRRYVNQVCDGLSAVLQRRGLVRTEFEHALFRDNMRSF